MVAVKHIGVPRSLQQPIPRGVPTLFEVYVETVPAGNDGVDISAADLGVARIVRGVACEQNPVAGGALVPTGKVAVFVSADGQTFSISHDVAGPGTMQVAALILAIP